MLKGRFVLALLFLFICFTGSALSQNTIETGERKPTIISPEGRWTASIYGVKVLGFETPPKDLDKLAVAWLKESLLSSFNLVDREKIVEILKGEARISDLIKKETAAKLQQLLGLHLAIEVSIIGYGNLVDVSATVLHLESGVFIQIVEVTGQGQDPETIKGLIKGELAKNIRDAFPPRGKVKEVNQAKKTVILNRGSKHGVYQNMRFQIYVKRRIGKINPIEKEEEIAQAEATDVHETYCEAVILTQRGELDPEVWIIVQPEQEFRGLAPLGQIDLTTEPPGASIAVDKKPLTDLYTPISIKIRPATCTISLSKPGFEPVESIVAVEAYKTVPLKKVLIPIKNTGSATFGEISITTKPSGASILLDNQPIALWTPATIRQVEPGTHNISLSKKGYKTWQGFVTVEAGKTTPLVVDLAPVGGGGTMNDYLQGKLNGERDAKGNPLWALAGLGCGIFGAGAAYFLKPSPPTHALIGKSAEYILGYTEGYQIKARNQNTMYACGGWLAFVAVYAAMGGFETTETTY